MKEHILEATEYALYLTVGNSAVDLAAKLAHWMAVLMVGCLVVHSVDATVVMSAVHWVRSKGSTLAALMAVQRAV
jgi:hypothetical protein